MGKDAAPEVIDRSNDFATDLLDSVAVPEDADFRYVMFALFSEASHVLLRNGWSQDELIHEVKSWGEVF